MLDVEVRADRRARRRTASRSRCSSGSKSVASRRLGALREGRGSPGRASPSPPRAIGPGDHVLQVRLAGAGDDEPRTDTRLHLVTVAPTPGVVLLASGRTGTAVFSIRDPARRGPASGSRVCSARRRALALDERPVRRRHRPGPAGRAGRGPPDPEGRPRVRWPKGSRARGIWRWPSGETGSRTDSGGLVPGRCRGLTDRRRVPGSAGGFVSAGDAADSATSQRPATGSVSPRSSAGGAQLGPPSPAARRAGCGR